jgi:hypothetical protein
VFPLLPSASPLLAALALVLPSTTMAMSPDSRHGHLDDRQILNHCHQRETLLYT